MQYKTIILELLRQRPQLHEQLRQSDTLLETLNEQAGKLKSGSGSSAPTIEGRRRSWATVAAVLGSGCAVFLAHHGSSP